MSFFADRPGSDLPEPEPDELVEREWFGPPLGVLPGLSLQRATPFRTADATLLIHRFEVFPTGVAFSADVYVRRGGVVGIPLMVHGPRYREGDQFTDDLIRFGLQMSDGSSCSNIDRPPIDMIESPDQPPVPPVISCNGGSSGGSRITATYWWWLLPPEGTVTFFAAWPAYGIPESSATIDGTELRATALRAERLW